MNTTDLLEKLEGALGEHGEATIESARHPIHPLWTCSIDTEPCGFGTGNTMAEAIEEALGDLEEARNQ